jgi:hypothetical protein
MKNLKYIFIAIVLGFTISCSERDPLEPHEEHFEASGLVLIKSGERFFKVFQGEIVSEMKVLEVPLGELTDHYSIKFLDDNGDEFDPPTDEDFSLDWEIDDENIAEVHQDEPGEWEFHLKGLIEGTTTFEIRVLHDDHFGFRTPKLPIEVK